MSIRKLFSSTLILIFCFTFNLSAQDYAGNVPFCDAGQHLIETACGKNGSEVCFACGFCGDGITDTTNGEACDAGAANAADGECRDCLEPACGDGVHNEFDELVNPNWTCDYTVDSDCRPDCTKCGDDKVNHSSEECDGADTPASGTCKPDCTLSICGDGFIDDSVGETCEVSDSACRESNCTKCGDNITQDAYEECDDGNDVDTDYCTNACTEAVCGDGIVGPGETCDDGNYNDADPCTNSCKRLCPDGTDIIETPCGKDNTETCYSCDYCGNGIVGSGEVCDDGNTDNNDDCPNNCAINQCEFMRVTLNKRVNFFRFFTQDISEIFYDEFDSSQDLQGEETTSIESILKNCMLKIEKADLSAPIIQPIIDNFFAPKRQPLPEEIYRPHMFTKIMDIIVDSSCKPVEASAANLENLCGARTIAWSATGNEIVSPVSLIWEEDYNPDSDPVITKFPVNLGKGGDYFLWKASDKAPLLVYDPKHTGKVLSARQLFGNWTFGGKGLASSELSPEVIKGHKWNNGYEALSAMDYDGNGKVDGEELADIALWFDSNRDGISDDGEVRPIQDSGIIALYYKIDSRDPDTKTLRVNKGFEQLVDGKIRTGSSIDWYTTNAESKDNLIQNYFKMIGAEVTSDTLIENKESDPLALKADLLAGAWSWEPREGEFAEEDQVEGGILKINTKGSRLAGLSIITQAIRSKKEPKDINLAFRGLPFYGEVKSDSGNALEFEFLINIDDPEKGVKTYNMTKARYIKNQDMIEATTTATGFNGEKETTISYDWIARRAP